MKSIKNKIQLIGNVFSVLVVHEGDFRYVKILVSTNENYMSLNGRKSTDIMYHTCYGFSKHVDIVDRYVKVGYEIAMEGSLINESYLVGHEEVVKTSIHIADLLILSNNR